MKGAEGVPQCIGDGWVAAMAACSALRQNES